MRIVFFATGDIGLPSLEALIQSPEHQVVLVVSQPDKPVGRKQVLTPPQIKVRALEAGIPVWQPEKLRAEVDYLKTYDADVFVVVAYGQILSQAVLDLPRLACLNIHASLLPRHRGAAPIQAAIREGDTHSGITIMWMEAGLDSGPILLQHRLTLRPDHTGGSLHDELAQMAPAALMEALPLVQAGKAPSQQQDENQVTHISKLTREHGLIQWHQPTAIIERQIRAYHPWPGSYTTYLDANQQIKRLKIYTARPHEIEFEDSAPGQLYLHQDQLIVCTQNGALQLLEVHPEGKKPMSGKQFMLGIHPPLCRLGT